MINVLVFLVLCYSHIITIHLEKVCGRLDRGSWGGVKLTAGDHLSGSQVDRCLSRCFWLVAVDQAIIQEQKDGIPGVNRAPVA